MGTGIHREAEAPLSQGLRCRTIGSYRERRYSADEECFIDYEGQTYPLAPVSNRLYLPLGAVEAHEAYYYDGTLPPLEGFKSSPGEVTNAFWEERMGCSRARFRVTDNQRLAQLREFLEKRGLEGLPVIDDYQLRSVTAPLTARAAALEQAALPCTLLAAALCAGAALLGTLQSRRTAALLRVLGVPARRIALALLLEQAASVLLGLIGAVWAVEILAGAWPAGWPAALLCGAAALMAAGGMALSAALRRPMPLLQEIR